MEDFPLLFEQFFKRLFIYVLLLATIIIGIPGIVVLSNPQNVRAAIQALSNPQKFIESIGDSSQSASTKTIPTKASGSKAPAHLLSMGWLVGDNTQLSAYNNLQVVSPLFAEVNTNNQVQLDSSQAFVSKLHAEGQKVWGRVALTDQSDTSTHQFLSNTNFQSIINDIVANAEQAQLDGINLDIEQIQSADFSSFTQFVQTLSIATHQANLALSIDLQPEPSTSPNLASLNQALGKYSDYLVFMGYDEHWSTDSTPGPVTSLQWLEDNIQQFIKTGIPARKLVLGLPSYSRIWQVDENGNTLNSNALANEYVSSLMKIEHNQETWQPSQAVYYTSYKKYGNTYKVWLTSNRSLEDYLNLITKYHLAGAGFWNLNMISSNDWNQIVSQFNSSHKNSF